MRPAPTLALWLSPIVALAQTENPPSPAPATASVAAPTTPATEAVTADEVRNLVVSLRKIQAERDRTAQLTLADAGKALALATVGPTEAVNLYIASVRAVDFEKTGKKQTDFEEWKKKNDARLHDIGYGQALRLQYRYLRLAIESDTEEKARAALPRLVALADESILALARYNSAAATLREDAFASPVATRFDLKKKRPAGWPASPLQLGPLYTLLMKASATEPDKLPGIWENRLRQEKALFEAGSETARNAARAKAGTPFGKKKEDPTPAPLTAEQENFEKRVLPRLRWEMGESLFEAGLRRRGLEILYTVLTKNPDHPSSPEWLDKLTRLAESLNRGSTEPAPAAGEPTAPAAPEPAAPAVAPEIPAK